MIARPADSPSRHILKDIKEEKMKRNTVALSILALSPS